MRLYAIIAAVTAAVGVMAFSQTNVFADANTDAGNAPAQNYITVQPGDYLAEIAANNNTTYVRIFDANQQIQDPNLIFPGEIIRIPSPTEQLPSRQLPTDVTDQSVSTQTSTAITDSDSGNTATTTQPSVTQTPAPLTVGTNVWDELAQCESGGNWSIDTGNGFYGGLQFSLSSWEMVGGSGYPNQASQSEQIMRAQMLQSQQGWGAWPVCSAKLGL